LAASDEAPRAADAPMENSAPLEPGFQAISVTWQSDLASRRFSYAGPQAERLLGFPLTAWYEEGFWEERIAREDRAHVVAQRRVHLDSGADIDAVYRMVTADGSHVLVREVSTVVRGDGGDDVLRGLFLSVGPSLAVGDMPDSVKAFASFVFHELSQPLGAVLANAEAMQRLLAADPPRVAEALDALADLIGSARNTASLLSGMRQSAR
jgi:signal transduction histidine kinase